MEGNYLDAKNVIEGKIIEYKQLKLLLLQPAGEAKTFIKESQVDKDTIVYAKQRWKVEIQPATRFDLPFVTHREIEYRYCYYRDIIDEAEPEYHDDNDTSDFNFEDNFGNAF